MKLGLFDHMQKHDIPRRSYRDLYKSHLELVEMADQEWIFILSRSTISIWFFRVSEPRQFSRRGFSTHQKDPFGTARIRAAALESDPGCRRNRNARQLD